MASDISKNVFKSNIVNQCPFPENSKLWIKLWNYFENEIMQKHHWVYDRTIANNFDSNDHESIMHLIQYAETHQLVSISFGFHCGYCGETNYISETEFKEGDRYCIECQRKNEANEDGDFLMIHYNKSIFEELNKN